MTSFIAMSFGLLVLVAGIWLLFDENVAKPRQALPAELRARAHGGIDTAFDHNKVKYLGDLGPAAAEMARRLRRSEIRRKGETIACGACFRGGVGVAESA